MTETTATTGTSTSPVEAAPADDSAIPEGGDRPGETGAAAPEPAPAAESEAKAPAAPSPEPSSPEPSSPEPSSPEPSSPEPVLPESVSPAPAASADQPAPAPELGPESVPEPKSVPEPESAPDPKPPPEPESAPAREPARPAEYQPAATLAGPAGTQTVPLPGEKSPEPPARPARDEDFGPFGLSRRRRSTSPGRETGPRTTRPAYTRPPGMLPPPEHPEATAASAALTEPTVGVPASAVLSAPPSGGYPGSATAVAPPVSAPPRATGRAPGGVTVRPIGVGTAVGAAPVTERMRPRPAATPRGPRRARLGLKRVDPWSVMKFSFAVSLVMFIVVIVAASVLYLALDTMGVFASINSTVADLVDAGGGESGDTFRITAQGVIGTAAVLGALNVLLFTSLATLGAFIYNVCADLVGGVEVTLAERD